MFSGCADDDFNKIDGVCPLVISTSPEDDATDVPLNKVITATFNEKMNPSTITEASFTVGNSDALINGNVTYTDSTAVFTPSSLLDENTEYTGVIKTLVKDIRGNAIMEDYVWAFVTISEFSVEVSSNPVLGGITTGEGLFDQGSTVTVTAKSNDDYTFTNWTENEVVVSTSANYQFVIAADRTLVANYIPVQFSVEVSSNPVLGGVTTGEGLFDTGTSITVTATPNDNYTFTNWTENEVVVSTSANYQFVITADRTLVANYSLIPPTQFDVNTSALPVEGGTTNGSDSFDEGTSVTVTATANTGYTFVNWTLAGVEVSTNTDYTFDLIENTNLVANFIALATSFTLNVTAVNGTIVKNPDNLTYNDGDNVELTATPDSGYQFDSWSGDATGTDNPLTVLMDADKNITANFSLIATSFTLDVTAEYGTVDKNPDNLTYNDGDNVELTPTPDSGYEFTSWSGDATGTDNPLTVLMDADKNITANFSLIGVAFTLNVTAVNGTVDKNPDQLTYNDGDNVELTATPDSGYEFDSWSGDATGTDNPLIVLMDSDKDITANFILTSAEAVGPGIIDLGTAGDFVILSKSGISNTGVTLITGNIGVSPIDQTAITGFSQIMDVTNTFSTSSYVVGKIYASDYTVPTPAYLTTAISDQETAFTTANGLTTNVIADLGAGDISGMTLAPGLYKWDTGLLITNAGVTLSGGPDDTWVFQISDDFTIDNNAIITLSGGAQAKNIFWITSTQALLGSNVQFKGNILAQTLISVNTGTTVNGRLLSQTAVTLNASTVVEPN